MTDSTWAAWQRVFRLAVFVVPMVLVALVYWPVYGAGLVWDDHTQFHDVAWLRNTSDWVQFALHGFSDWKNYFRPLGVALFAAETRLLDVAPAPMHLLSLGLHLINTLLVGALARAMAIASNPPARPWLLPCIAMLLFGLHPVLIEPVVWIASQFELLLTLFMLLGLLANLTLRNRAARAAIVALCFFLAACSKEAAIAFPLLLLIVDWLRPVETQTVDRPWQVVSVRLRQQWPIYLAVLVAGIVYLAARYWGLGFLMNSYGHTTSLSWPRVHLINFTYLAYWKLLVWPMAGLGPIHIVPAQQFADFTVATAATDAVALAIILIGFYLLWKRKLLGGLIMGVTAALLPVLHVIPIEFEESIYHDRYAMTAVAIVSALLPNVVAEWLGRLGNRRLASYALSLVAAAGWSQRRSTSGLPCRCGPTRSSYGNGPCVRIPDRSSPRIICSPPIWTGMIWHAPSRSPTPWKEMVAPAQTAC